MLQPGRNCWRIEPATRASVIVDADDYFRAARAAMLKAETQILLVGWDFDARIRLVPEGEACEGPAEVGPFLSWLAKRKPGLRIHILRWRFGALATAFHATTLATLLKWKLGRRIHVKLDGHHPKGASHHQKIVVIDDCLAFCGGIDMTVDRWDTRCHADEEPGRVEPGGKAYGPWHDATTALEGPVAKALGELCRDRWQLAGGKPLAVPDSCTDCWPDDLPTCFRDAKVAISRTRPEMPDVEPVDEIEQLYIDLIARAKRWIYAESQYFASRRIAEAISKRLEEPDGPEIVVVNPQDADGWLEQVAMDTTRARLFEALRRLDRQGGCASTIPIPPPARRSMSMPR